MMLMISSRIEQRLDLEECQREAEPPQVHQKGTQIISSRQPHSKPVTSTTLCKVQRSRASFEIECIAVSDPRVAEPRCFIRSDGTEHGDIPDGLRQQRSGLREASLQGKFEMSRQDARRRGGVSLDGKSRDESRASINENNLDAKIETERPSYTQGPCSDSACGRQHEGVVSARGRGARSCREQAGGHGAR